MIKNINPTHKTINQPGSQQKPSLPLKEKTKIEKSQGQNYFSAFLDLIGKSSPGYFNAMRPRSSNVWEGIKLPPSPKFTPSERVVKFN